MENARVLLHVDDDPIFTRLVAQKLTSRGFEVISLNDPTQALELLNNQPIRVVLLDIDMPGTDGTTLLRQIKQFDGGIQAVMLTGLVSQNSVLNSFRGGANACFFKPITDWTVLIESLVTSFDKIDHWCEVLSNLTNERRTEHELQPVRAT